MGTLLCLQELYNMEYTRIQSGEEEEAITFFYEVFVRDEGQLNSLKAGRNQEVTRDMKKLLAQGVSLAARGMSGKMVGQMLCEVHYRSDFMDTENITSYSTLLEKYGDPAWARFFHLGANHVFSPWQLFMEFPVLDKVFDLGCLIVVQEDRRKGVAAELFRRGESLAKELGCQGMIVIASTAATVKVAHKFEMVIWREFAWKDYKNEKNEQVFNIPREKGDKIFSFIKIFP